MGNPRTEGRIGDGQTPIFHLSDLSQVYMLERQIKVSEAFELLMSSLKPKLSFVKELLQLKLMIFEEKEDM